jgi:hypothetical protein
MAKGIEDRQSELEKVAKSMEEAGPAIESCQGD